MSENVESDSKAACHTLSIDFVSLISDWARDAFKYVALNPFERRCAAKERAKVVFPEPGGLRSSKTFSSSSQAFMVSNLRMSMIFAMSGPSVDKKLLVAFEAEKKSVTVRQLISQYTFSAFGGCLLSPCQFLLQPDKAVPMLGNLLIFL